MSTQRGKKASSTPGKQPSPPPRRTSTEVQPVSPVGLVISIAAALVIAFILLFVINARINANQPAAALAAPTKTAVAAAPAAPTSPPQKASSDITQVGGFAKGNPQAKVTVIEYADFK